MGTLMGTLYETWSKDPVHGEKRAYTKIGLALLHFLDKKKGTSPAVQSRKRTRDGDSPASGEDHQDTHGQDRERGGYVRGGPLGSAYPHEVCVCDLPWRFPLHPPRDW
jgi:hypothetical protein